MNSTNSTSKVNTKRTRIGTINEIIRKKFRNKTPSDKEVVEYLRDLGYRDLSLFLEAYRGARDFGWYYYINKFGEVSGYFISQWNQSYPAGGYTMPNERWGQSHLRAVPSVGNQELLRPIP